MDKKTYQQFIALKEKVINGSANFKERNIFNIITKKKSKKNHFILT